jgi:hypothetical protein
MGIHLLLKSPLNGECHNKKSHRQPILQKKSARRAVLRGLGYPLSALTTTSGSARRAPDATTFIRRKLKMM